MGIDKEGGKGGVVMNISSTAGVTCRTKISYALPAYYASKHAVVSLTRCFGVDISNCLLFLIDIILTRSPCDISHLYIHLNNFSKSTGSVRHKSK